MFTDRYSNLTIVLLFLYPFPVLQVFFLPMSNTIITGFKDDTIFGWESDTLNCKYQLPIPPGKTPHYKAYAPTRYGICTALHRNLFMSLNKRSDMLSFTCLLVVNFNLGSWLWNMTQTSYLTAYQCCTNEFLSNNTLILNLYQKAYIFKPPSFIGPLGASSVWIVHLSVCLSVGLSVCPSVIPSCL